MFEKVKGKIDDIKKDRQLRKEERARIEKERIQLEKDALMALSEKELMVEAIMALRGYNTRLTNIEEQQDELNNRVNSLESDVSSLGNSVSNLKTD